MNINETLLRELGASGPSQHDYLSIYETNDDDIKDFLLTNQSPDDKQKKAIMVIENIFGYHGKGDLIHHIVRLAKLESGIMELQPWQRDHVVHALICFILGIFLNEKWMPTKVDPFEWKLSCLLHDICYPAEFSFTLLSSIPEDIKIIAYHIECPPPQIKITTKIEGLENLNNNRNGLELIQSRVSSWDLDVDVYNEYRRMQENKPCHGMYSSLASLLVLDMMYQKNNPEREYKDIRAVEPHISWNQQYFEGQIVSACSSIFLHNLPACSFEDKKISRYRSPSAFLLKLCDSLQEWERPSRDNEYGDPSTDFDISITNKGLEFITKLPTIRSDKLFDDITGVIEAPDVIIVCPN